MGEIAEMMLDGTLCESCGEYIGESGWGIPRYCSPECAANRGADYQRMPEDYRHEPRTSRSRRKIRCDLCGKRCKSEDGLAMHMRDKHGAKATPPPESEG